MIKSYTNGEWKEPGSLCQAVGIYKEDFHKIVSVVGGGGKTTVLRAMLRECMENSDGRIPCAVSTTTHIQKTNAEYFLGEPSMKMFRKKLSDYEVVWMGREIRKGKLASFQKEFLEEVSREPVLLLLEADGAKHFPVKAPAEHEPVICENGHSSECLWDACDWKKDKGCMFSYRRSGENSWKDRGRYFASRRYHDTCGKSECRTQMCDG